jgi:hypothetical protein
MKNLAVFSLFVSWSFMVSGQRPQPGYKVLTGKIGETSATLHFHISGEKITSWLWFGNMRMPMQCYALYLPAKDSLTINAIVNPLSVTLSGIYKPGEFRGTITLEKEGNKPKNSTFNLLAFNDTPFTRFSYNTQNAQLIMPVQFKNESTGSCFFGSVWPEQLSNKPLEFSLKKSINLLMGNSGAVKEISALLVSAKNKFVSGWNNDNAKMKSSDAKDMGLSLSREEEHIISVMYEDRHVISLADYNYSFTGGAHGNYITSIVNIDKQSGAVIMLKDILTAEGIKALPQILEAVLRMQYGLDKNKTLEENGIFVKKMEPSKNFYFTNGNLGFIYSPYEIMAFSYGEPNLFIPASAIARWVKPAFRQ